MKNFRKISGKLCYLSPINPEDAERFTEWINNFEVTFYMNQFQKNIGKQLGEKIISEHAMNGNQMYSIIDNETQKVIGYCNLFDINFQSDTAEAGIMIGERNFWNRGFGKEALTLLLDIGFNTLNLRNILIRVFDFNKRAVKCFEKVGFKKIGKRRNSVYRAGKIYNIIYMDILDSEFESPVIKNILEEAVNTDKLGSNLEIVL